MSFDPKAVILETESILKKAQQIHHDAELNVLASLALAAYVKEAHPNHEQTSAITKFMDFLMNLGAKKQVVPDRLNIPVLFPPEAISKMTPEEIKKALESK
jgi:hypothetical protein